MINFLSKYNFIYFFKFIIKYVIINFLIIIIIKKLHLPVENEQYEYNINLHNNKVIYNFKEVYIENITNIRNIFITLKILNYYYYKENELILVNYYFQLNDINDNIIKPSDLSLIYNLVFLCDIYLYENNENIYSYANNNGNQFYYCREHIKLSDHIKFGIKIFKMCEIDEEVEYYEKFFFTDEFIKSNLNFKLENNNNFNINYIIDNYNSLLLKIKKYKKSNTVFKKSLSLKFSYIKTPIFYLKNDISLVDGRWYFNNIYGHYFCFCRGENCINIKNFNNYNSQSCKYYFYLTIIDLNKNLYIKSYYLLSDFFNANIEGSDAFPIFKTMLKENLNVYYLTMSLQIYNQFNLNNKNNYSYSPIIYGVRKINGDALEKYLELFLKLKVVITAEKYDSIDNLFYNIEYITYIFLGHGVQYIKSYLYKEYLSYKNYDRMLLPPCEKIIKVAINGGWKKENIIKIGLPKWDNYEIYHRRLFNDNENKYVERAIFLMFTWRKLKRGRNMSELYYNNINNIINDIYINELLEKKNIKLYFCYHHSLVDKRKIKKSNNTIYINQNDISSLLKNCSLIITDFSAIMFDAIVQKKPLVLYIPDALDNNIKNLYIPDYYETIEKIKNGIIYLYEIFFNLNEALKKIIYYINNDFILEEEKLKYYNKFRFKNKGNTKKFIRYIKML